MKPAGIYEHRITILRNKSRRRNDIGEIIADDEATETRWAKVTPLSAREVLANGQVGTEITHKVEMRYSRTLTTQDKIEFRSRILNIASIINSDEDNSELVLLCIEQR
jgi:SPP1 family predicted phage head-tail adaptor